MNYQKGPHYITCVNAILVWSIFIPYEKYQVISLSTGITIIQMSKVVRKKQNMSKRFIFISAVNVPLLKINNGLIMV